MSNRFINKIYMQNINSAPSLVRTDVQVEDINSTSTTGNQLTDIMLNTAIKYSRNLDEMKRNNEIAKSKVNLQKAIQDYELSWDKKDKFSDDNYIEYKQGLENIYEQARVMFSDTKYTNESDVLSWENQIDSQKDTAMYRTEGARADYEIKKYSDETVQNANSLFELYKQTGDNDLKKEALNLYNSLSKVGIPQYKIEGLKIQQAISSDKAMLEIQANSIINDPNLSLQEKRQQISNLQNNLMNDDIYKTSAQMAIDEGLVSAEYAEAYSNQLKATYRDAFLKNDGLISRFDTAIRNEQYRLDTLLENNRIRTENERLKLRNSLVKAYKSGNDYKVISLIEGREVTPYDLVVNKDLSMKYYGKTPMDILKDDGYIPTHSIYEINDIKNKSRVDEDNNINRMITVGSIYEDVLGRSSNDEEFKNTEREFISNGVLSNLEANVYSGNAKFESIDGNNPTILSKEDIINNAFIGKKKTMYNKLGGFVGLSTSSPLYKNISDLDSNKRETVCELITGSILNSKFSTLFNGKNITVGTVNAQYNNNPEFRGYVNAIINGVRGMDNKRYRKANMINKDYEGILESKFKDNDIKVRKQTLESGLEPTVEEYNDILNDF